MRAGEIDVWQVHIPHFHLREKELFELLDDREKARALRFVFPHLTTRYIVGHAVLRMVLAKYTGIDPKDIAFRYGERGKPYLMNNSCHIEFNYSDSGEKILIGISINDEIGVDIEKINSKILTKGLQGSVFSENELKLFDKQPNKIEAFYCGWTHKEAMLKLLGTGLYLDLKMVEVPLELATETKTVRYADKIQYVRSFVIANEYYAAIASNALITDIKNLHFNDGD